MDLRKPIDALKKKTRYKLTRLGKRGSYIAEAALTLPVFILCVVSLALVINVIAACENTCYLTTVSLHEVQRDAVFDPMGIGVKAKLRSDVGKGAENMGSFSIKKLDYLYSYKGTDDLIALKTITDFRISDPIGISGKISFSQNVLCRGFTGALWQGNRLGVSDFESDKASEKVLVFPRYGEKFHREGCRYTTHYYSEKSYMLIMEKEDAIRKGYEACLVCGG